MLTSIIVPVMDLVERRPNFVAIITTNLQRALFYGGGAVLQQTQFLLTYLYPTGSVWDGIL